MNPEGAGAAATGSAWGAGAFLVAMMRDFLVSIYLDKSPMNDKRFTGRPYATGEKRVVACCRVENRSFLAEN